MTDFNLSERRNQGLIKGVYWEEDVKEFIRLLKEKLDQEAGSGQKDWCDSFKDIRKEIDALAGEKLK